jgi:hypothetical protein
VSYPWFKKEWWAYRQTYYSMAEDDLVAKYLRKKCISKNVNSMTGNIEDLSKIWNTLETCSEN